MSPALEAISTRRPRVVIIGGGFGGLSAARALRSAPVEVIVLDRVNHHLFQPLLYQVATATLPPSDITAPIRWLLRNQANATVLLGNARRAAPGRKSLLVEFEESETEISYDYLIIAAGARHSYFGNDSWENLAPGLKTMEDALEIRRRFLLAFERAEWCEDEADRLAHQTFVVVGGGPTGVELAGILPEIARRTMRRDFRRIDPSNTRVILLEGGSRVLPSFSIKTSARVTQDLAALGVEVRTGAVVTNVASDAVYLGDERISARTVFWAAGNKGSAIAESLGVPLDRYGRVEVERDLSVPGFPEMFVVGDLASVVQNGKQVPGVAPAANQEGRLAASNIKRSLQGKERLPFRYRSKGNLATIGRHKAVAEFGNLRFYGRFAWWLWLFAHILYLAGFRNRLSVLVEWAYAYFAYERGARLITRA